MKLVNQWYKKWSVWLLAIAAALTIPAVQQYMPPDWEPVAFGIILAARIIQQKNSPE